jgi:hypothetical protein
MGVLSGTRAPAPCPATTDRNNTSTRALSIPATVTSAAWDDFEYEEEQSVTAISDDGADGIDVAGRDEGGRDDEGMV